MISALAFVVMSGISVSGIIASLMELVVDRPLSFSEPYVSRRRPVRSLAAAVAAGPIMLASDAVRARRQGAISGLGLGLRALTALVWAGVSGIVVATLAVGLQALLS